MGRKTMLRVLGLAAGMVIPIRGITREQLHNAALPAGNRPRLAEAKAVDAQRAREEAAAVAVGATVSRNCSRMVSR